IVGAAKIARDITGHKHAAEERERLLREAQQGVQLRDVFLSVAGHEFRTPLNTLRLQLHNLDRSLTTESQHAPPATPPPQLDRLSARTDRLLDVSRMAAGGFTLDPAPMDLSDLVAEVAGRLAEDAARAGCDVRLSAPRPVVGAWDRRGLDQVVTNILTNALKF